MVWGCCQRRNEGDVEDASHNPAMMATTSHQGVTTRTTSELDGVVDTDKRAVDWWRNHQKEHADGNVVVDDEKGTSLAVTNVREVVLHHKKNVERRAQHRMEERNPLTKPYSLETRELPLKPRDSDVIHPSASTPSTVATTPNQSLEVFQAEVELAAPPVSIVGKDSNELNSRSVVLTKESTGEQLQIVSTASDIDVSPLAQSPDRNQTFAFQSDKTTSTKQRTTTTSATKKRPLFRKRDQSRGIIDQLQEQEKFQGTEDDRLSDVPSDVDSVMKDRYLLACQMLKNQLVAKEKSLAPIERDFIISLLGEYNNEREEASVITEDQVSSIEHAVMKLDTDPRFTFIDTNQSCESVQSGVTNGSAQRLSYKRNMPAAQDLLVIPKNPHTATRRPINRKPESRPKISQFLRACHPSANILDDEASSHYESHGMLPRSALFDDATERSETSTLIRFDGWNSHKSTESPFRILGTNQGGGSSNLHPRVLSPSMMEAFRGFLPSKVCEFNFWLKFSLVRDGASLLTLLSSIKASSTTIIGVETKDGEVFGSFTGTPWRIGSQWFGTGQAFLWRMKKSRLTLRQSLQVDNFENEMEVYPFTGYDDLVQYCTAKTIAVGGGVWANNTCPFPNEPKGIGFMIDGDLAGGETNSCSTFSNPRLCKKVSASNEFTISNLEVWTLTPCHTETEATEKEMKQLVSNGPKSKMQEI